MIELKIPTAQEFVTSQEQQKTIGVNNAIKSICKQIEVVFDYIKNASNGEHHIKIYKEIIISLDVDIHDIGMEQVIEKLKLMSFKVSMFGIDNWKTKLANESNTNYVYDHDIFSTMNVGNGGQTFDERHYGGRGLLPKRRVKSVMVLHTK